MLSICATVPLYLCEFFIQIAWWWLASDEKQFPLHKRPSLLMLSDGKCDIQGVHASLWATDSVI